MDILSYRSEHTITQSEFAARLTAAGSPATQGLISQWEKGEVTIPAERIAKIFEVTEGKVTGPDLRPDVFGPTPHSMKAA